MLLCQKSRCGCVKEKTLNLMPDRVIYDVYMYFDCNEREKEPIATDAEFVKLRLLGLKNRVMIDDFSGRRRKRRDVI